MTKKFFIISIIAIIVIAALVIGSLFLFTKKPTVAGQTVPDLSKNYGACDLASVGTIKQALGNPAKSLQAGFDTGKGNIGNGDVSQNCVYGLSSKVTSISSSMLTDTFYTTVYVYSDSANQKVDEAAYPKAITVNNIGDSAYFIAQTYPSLDVTDYTLRVNVGLRYFGFSIRQATDHQSYTASSAQTVLTNLAKKVGFAKFANKN